MIRIFCVAVIVIAITAFGGRPTQASEAPWCAMTKDGDFSDCQYRSIEECLSGVLAGNRGWCNPNPAYRGVEQPQGKHPRRRH